MGWRGSGSGTVDDGNDLAWMGRLLWGEGSAHSIRDAMELAAASGEQGLQRARSCLTEPSIKSHQKQATKRPEREPSVAHPHKGDSAYWQRKSEQSKA
jgi:hypothetical protein